LAADTKKDIYEDSIGRGHFAFPARAWSGNKSDKARDFTRCLLRRDSRRRFTAKEAVMHPWIVNTNEMTQQRI